MQRESVSTEEKKRNNGFAIILMLAAVACFYAGDKFTSILSKSLDSVIPALFMRTLLSAIILALYFIVSNKKNGISTFLYYCKNHIELTTWIMVRCIGYLCAIICFASSFLISKDMTSVYMFSFFWPLFVIIFGLTRFSPQDDKKLTMPEIVINVLLMSGPIVYNIDKNITTDQSLIIFGSCAALLYSLIVIALKFINDIQSKMSASIKKTYQPIDAIQLTFITMLFGSFVLFIINIGIYTGDAHINIGEYADAWTIFVMFMAAIASLFGVILMNLAFNKGDSGRVSPFEYTSVLYTALSEHIFERQALLANQFIGIVIVVLFSSALLFYAFFKKERLYK